ncbi:MAG: LysM peptidoglycan-binding domain-containing protein [Candidatus Omnitrophica bacterium]|nr:LysM peptidoglycan-binding domain-containing protein [Candidatus Omnitrophota bacterium]
MRAKNLPYFIVLASVLALSGCVTRTYSLTRDRVDQDLSGGNHGYITGKAPAGEASPRKTERTVRVFEIELGKAYKAKQTDTTPVAQPQNMGSSNEITDSLGSIETASEEQNTSFSKAGQKYTVEKNDTLQKISMKFYGTTKKWTKIYNANKDVLKGPNRVYPGQTLNIPDSGDAKPATEALSEPKENLK